MQLEIEMKTNQTYLSTIVFNKSLIMKEREV